VTKAVALRTLVLAVVLVHRGKCVLAFFSQSHVIGMTVLDAWTDFEPAFLVKCS
jgi:hypothetical protein